MGEHGGSAVVDASVLVDLLAGTEQSTAAASLVRATALHAPAHLDAEVLSALGRLQHASHMSAVKVDEALWRLTRVPLARHLLPDLLPQAWRLRAGLRLVDALYVALAERLGLPLLTTDHRLARAYPGARTVSR